MSAKGFDCANFPQNFYKKSTEKHEMMRNKVTLSAFVAAILVMPIAFADAGVAPLMFVNIQLLPFLLVPIIFIEAFVIKKFLKVNYGKSLLYSGIANIVSTVVGYLVLSILIFPFTAIYVWVTNLISKGIFSASFFQSIWFIIIISFVGLIFSFLLTVISEYLVLRAFFEKKNKKIVVKTTWIANIISYVLLVLVVVFFSILSALS